MISEQRTNLEASNFTFSLRKIEFKAAQILKDIIGDHQSQIVIYIRHHLIFRNYANLPRTVVKPANSPDCSENDMTITSHGLKSFLSSITSGLTVMSGNKSAR